MHRNSPVARLNLPKRIFVRLRLVANEQIPVPQSAINRFLPQRTCKPPPLPAHRTHTEHPRLIFTVRLLLRVVDHQVLVCPRSVVLRAEPRSDYLSIRLRHRGNSISTDSRTAKKRMCRMCACTNGTSRHRSHRSAVNTNVTNEYSANGLRPHSFICIREIRMSYAPC
jgi:hypothetical protein